MIRRPWLIPIVLPLFMAFVLLRVVRLPLNALLWACTEAGEYMLMDRRDRSFTWCGWRHLWGWM